MVKHLQRYLECAVSKFWYLINRTAYPSSLTKNCYNYPADALVKVAEDIKILNFLNNLIFLSLSLSLRFFDSLFTGSEFDRT